MANASYGGLGSKSFADDVPVSGGSFGVGRTFLGSFVGNRLLQNGTITSVKYLAHASIANGYKFKVFRPNGSNFDFVGESEKFTPVSGSTQTRTLTTPITGVRPGDVLGYWIDIDATETVSIGSVKTDTGKNVVWLTGDNVGSNQNFTNTLSDFSLNLEAFGLAPVAAMTGDSIMAGHGSNYSTLLDGTGPAGDISAELGYQLRQAIGSSFTYQGYSMGGQTWSWVRLTAFPAMQSGTGVHQSGDLNNTEYWVNAGVNDIFQGRSWPTVQADMDAVYALCGSRTLYIFEIIPDSNFNDVQAALIRTFNTNYNAWAVGKASVRIIPVWALMGSLRSSTGLNDNLLHDSGDGVHEDATGAAIMAGAGATVRASYSPDVTPPGVPAAVSESTSYIVKLLSWAASTDNVSLQGDLVYNIYEDGGSSPLATTAPGVTSYSVSHPLSASHTYQIEAQDSVGNKSAKSAPLLVNFTSDALALTIGVDGSGHPVLTWVADPGAAHYLILRSSSAQGAPSLVAVVATPILTYTDTGGSSGDFYSIVSTQG